MQPFVLENKADYQLSKTQLYKNKVKIAIAIQAKDICRYKNIKGSYSTETHKFSLTNDITTIVSPQTMQI
jgi:hypothetical protein